MVAPHVRAMHNSHLVVVFYAISIRWHKTSQRQQARRH